jgi:hypothetical protein
MNFDAVRPNLYRAYWAGVIALTAYAALQGAGTPPLLLVLGAGMAVFALFPAYLWCSGRVDGLPLFPLFALTHAQTYAMPMIAQNRAVARYSSEAQIEAALSVMAFLGVGTLAWLWASSGRPPRIRRAYWGFAPRGNNWAFLLGLVLAITIFIVIANGVLVALLPEGNDGFLSAFRSVAMSLTVLCATVLSFRAGQRELSPFEQVAFVTLFIMTLMMMAAGLIMNAALAGFLVAVGVFTISRGRVPFVTVGIAFVIFSLLHVGKWPMREKYLSRGYKPIPVESIPGRYVEWFGHGLEDLPATLTGDKYSRKRHQTLVERGSLLQMLLLVQTKTPEYRDYLGGRTYSIIPELLVPRVLNPKKLRAHEGTYILSIHYGLQSARATTRTTIAFGLLSESYANFGHLGVLGLGLLSGIGYALGARWSLHAPVTSLRGLFALLLLASTIAVEHTAGVFVTVLFQGTMILCALALVAMRSQPAPVLRQRPVMPAPAPHPRSFAAGGVP